MNFSRASFTVPILTPLTKLRSRGVWFPTQQPKEFSFRSNPRAWKGSPCEGRWQHSQRTHAASQEHTLAGGERQQQPQHQESEMPSNETRPSQVLPRE